MNDCTTLLLTDLYQLNMIKAYLDHGHTQTAVFEFFTGAFKIASEAGLPVYPGVMRGTRSILRSDQWFPRWGHVDVEILDPFVARGTDFESVLHLRDTVRQAVLSRCGEPDLRELVKPDRTKE